MRCRRHPLDDSSTVGVCASCLRDRLYALIDAQSRAYDDHFPPHSPQHNSRATEDQQDRPSTDHHLPHLEFPHSVSPYVAGRKAEGQGFIAGGTSSAAAVESPLKRRNGKFSHISNIFRFASKKDDPSSNVQDRSGDSGATTSYYSAASPFSFRSEKEHHNSSNTGVPSRDSNPMTSASASPFRFFPKMVHGRRKTSRLVVLEESVSGDGTNCPVIDRGMSPSRDTDSDHHCEDCDQTVTAPAGWPSAAATRRHKRVQGGTRSVLGFCLSPLVRAGPSLKTPEMAYSGEFRKTTSDISASTLFCKNRSRKIADFGRGFRSLG